MSLIEEGCSIAVGAGDVEQRNKSSDGCKC